MGDAKKRPAVDRVSVNVETASGTERREGHDLDHVLAAVLWDIQESMGWSEAELAAHLGLKQQNVNRILNQQGGTSLAVLSRVCAALKMTPVRVFESHELYRPENRASMGFVEDAVFDRFRAAIRVDQARTLLEILDEATRRGILDEMLSTARGMLGRERRGRDGRKHKRSSSG